jgi:hypothetical protein
VSRPGDVARILAAAPGDASGLLTATVVTWNATDGYIVSSGGIQLAVTTALASAGDLQPGDVVALLRFKTTVLVLGQVQALTQTTETF